jgi:CRISPR-associated exonuclease Cas4
MEWILILSTGLLLAALALLWISARQRRSTGLPEGGIRYSDTGQRVEKTLYDPISGLAGKPDYLVEADGALIPVEVKSGRAPSIPHDSHIFQLAAYCRLVERVHGQRPPYGILRYRDRTFPVPFTPELEGQLDALLADMRRPERKKNSSRERSHQEPARCARCGYRSICDQRL